ncbi:MAG: hypothetical protein JWM16_5034 [Verrucomicrobiales bacterium]|nr:hypothetical protein [Verrucomicrobiales bacterium]
MPLRRENNDQHALAIGTDLFQKQKGGSYERQRGVVREVIETVEKKSNWNLEKYRLSEP